ncbi:MAG: outer membrane lipoprotein carrier protein LolA [Bacteroidia bacterium]|nr:outer membrane lipoprotein carrier protein LolA [Bacteroidia bacterium]
MNIHKTLSSLLVLLSLCSSVVYAQTDARAQEVLKAVSAKYKSYKSLEAAFKLSRLDQKTKSTENFNGKIIISGSRFNFVLNDQTVMSDGKTTWTYLKESNEVQISETKTSEGAITPTNIFTMYEKGFKSKFMGEKTIAGKAVQQIELTPDDPKKNYFKIMLNIDKTGKFVSEAKIFEKNGGILTYSIVKFTPNIPVSDDSFVFNKLKFPGVDVVDLR